MVERLHLGENYRSLPVQKMPDFEAAIKNYEEILTHAKVDSESIDRNVGEIVANNKTRQEGNRFINHVNQISRGLSAK